MSTKQEAWGIKREHDEVCSPPARRGAMDHTDKRKNGAGSFRLMVAVLGTIMILGLGFSDIAVQCKRVFAHPNGIRTPFLAPSLWIQALEAPASANAQQKFFSLVGIEDAEETLPKFVIQGNEFTVVIHKQRLKWPAESQHRFDPDCDETARSLEVRDATGATVYEHGIEDAADESDLAEIRKQGRFIFTEAVYGCRMEGAKNQALVISWSSTPSAPGSCSMYIVLGLFDGKLVPFSEPFCADIVSLMADVSDRNWKLKKDRGTNFEIFEIRIGYGFFHVIVPIRVDFMMAKMFPARWCIRMGAPAGLAEYCEFPVEAERRADEEDTFVRLFPDADETRTPRHVIVKPDSKIEFLTALAPNVMDRNGKWRHEQGFEIPWLKVRIDGKEGWVHAEEDLNALGLFQVG